MAKASSPAQPIVDTIKDAYNKVTKIFGDPSEPVYSKAYQMKDLPADNPNRKAWENATRFQGPPKKAEAKRATSQKPSPRKPAPAKSTAKKRLVLKNN